MRVRVDSEIPLMGQLRAIIESLLFVSEVPLSLEKIKAVLSMYTHGEITTALEGLRQEFAGDDHGVCLVEVAQGYQFRSKPEFGQWIRSLKRITPTRLSQAALETLAIIAYKQPILRAEIESIRGVDVGGVVRLLLEKKLIKILGRKDVPGRPIIYGTTKRFLEVFSLKDISSLPTLDELEGLTDHPGSAEGSKDS
ncbi:MAG: SMC-Scp complex subunit ScpB [Deltaproteobacteria bacterium]|nr:MAG: SMC-Scp complex subunit ScpB [Deltaproteobacteria bacterium]